jgi:hypothetical protein
MIGLAGHMTRLEELKAAEADAWAAYDAVAYDAVAYDAYAAAWDAAWAAYEAELKKTKEIVDD